jgi:hypothetical protein
MSRETADTKNYVSILSSDGTFRLSVPEGTPGSVKREWAVGEKTGVKNELVYKSLTGKITDVGFVDTENGKLLQVTITDEEGDLTISVGAGNNFGIDLMKKLPNLKKGIEYKFAPYSFTDDKGKSQKGVSITLDGEKIKNFFYDGTKLINGMPEPEGDTKKYTKNKWKAYFGSVEDFLIEYTEKNSLVEEEISSKEVPF